MKKLPLSIMNKLLLSILLSLCMVLTLPPIAFAAGTDGTIYAAGTDDTDGTVGMGDMNDTDSTGDMNDTDSTGNMNGSGDTDGSDSTGNMNGSGDTGGSDSTGNMNGSGGTGGTDSTGDMNGSGGTGDTDSTGDINGSGGTGDTDDTDDMNGTDDTDSTAGTDDTDSTDNTDSTDGIDDTDDTAGTDGTDDTDGTAGTDDTAGTDSTDGPSKSYNIHQQNYMLHLSSTVKSYLFENESGGLTRVDYPSASPSGTVYIPSHVIVEDYDSDFVFQRSYSIPRDPDMNVWGGFFAGEDYNFFVFGQRNYDESDDVEVIRVVKYSKDWERLGQASLYGKNTTDPFNASLRFAEYNGDLYIHTSHEMYKYSDGVNHQANMNILVRESDMAVLGVLSDISNSMFGYVSHSFNQFVIIDQQQRIVTLDHGDANPRSAVLMEYIPRAGEGKFIGVNRSTNIQGFPQNNTHYNYTGASLGGLAETNDGYVITYNYDGAGQSITAANRNVYLAYVDKDSFSVEKKAISKNIGNTTPVLVPTGLDGGYILWNESDDNGKGTDTLHYVSYSDGGQVGEIKTAIAPLSDCQPIVYGDKVVWYVTDDTVPVFYQLDDSGVTRTPLKPLTEDMFEVETTDAIYTGSAVTRSIIGKDGKRTLVQDLDYTVDYTNNTEEGEATITITGIGSYAGTLTYTFNIVKLKSLTKDMFTVGSADEIYTGKNIRKTITGKDGDNTLVRGTHYEVTYANNSEIGTATITITGIGVYTGTLTYTFNIVESISLTEDMFIVDTTDEIYTGSYIYKTITGKYGEKTLNEGTDYVVFYDNRKDIGEATITIAGRNGYTGELKYTFNIIKLLTKSMFTVDVSPEVYNGKEITKTITGKCGSNTLVKDTDYTVEYTNNTTIGTATITITGIGYYFGTLTYTFNIKAAAEITAVTVNGDQIVVTIRAYEARTQMFPIAAFYQNGKMTAVVTKAARMTNEFRLDIPSGAEGQQCKVFLLDSRTLAPLSPSWESVNQ